MTDRPSDLDLRLVRYFTVVADHGHVGRAAEQLLVAQPSLSRQVQRLEAQLGARLFDRTSRGVSLTDAGRALLPRAQAILRAADEAAAATRRAADPMTIKVGYAGNLIVTPAAVELRRRHPAAVVETLHVDWDALPDVLFDGRIDVVLTRMLGPVEGVETTWLYDEPRVLVVPRGHRLAGRVSVTLEDFAAEPLVRFADDRMNGFWRIDPRPDGSPAPEGPRVAAAEDKLERVAAGEALTMMPGGSVDTLRPDLVAVPVDGIAPVDVVVATRVGERSALVADFVAIAEKVLPDQASASRAITRSATSPA